MSDPRSNILSAAFADIPSQCGPFVLRPLSPGSYTLLGQLGNPMITGSADPSDQSTMFRAVAQYVWIHSAPLEAVVSVLGGADIPADQVGQVAFQLTMGEMFDFLSGFERVARRISLSMVEAEAPADPGKPETLPTGSHRLLSVSVPPVTQSENSTCFGGPQSSEPLPTFTLSNVPPESNVDTWPALTILDPLPTSTSDSPN